jgi:hypothetical protein
MVFLAIAFYFCDDYKNTDESDRYHAKLFNDRLNAVKWLNEKIYDNIRRYFYFSDAEDEYDSQNEKDEEDPRYNEIEDQIREFTNKGIVADDMIDKYLPAEFRLCRMRCDIKEREIE